MSLSIALLCATGSQQVAAQAMNPGYSAVSRGYSNCFWRDNNNGTSSVGVTILFDGLLGNTGGNFYLGRGIALYTYNDRGHLTANASVVEGKMKLNGVESGNSVYRGIGYVLFARGEGQIGEWGNPNYRNVDITMTLKNSEVNGWPGVAVRAGNKTNSNDVLEINGAAYITKNSTDGSCQLIQNPVNPPPPVDTEITVDAPDWDLGELKRNKEVSVILNKALCFRYDNGSTVAADKYVISAMNDKGVANNKYLLAHKDDQTATIPYGLTLTSTDGSQFSLPSSQPAEIQLSASGSTCFYPRFTAKAAAGVKDGDYSDVLTFTIATKP